VNAEYTVEHQPIAPSLVEAIAILCKGVFELPAEDLPWRLEAMPRVSVACARIRNELIGFKVGYAHSQSRYYSWLGGVHPGHRRQGIAFRLTELQHSWAREQGFQVVETATNQENTAMIQANLKCGFFICGLKHKQQQVQVLFSKALS
jgi:GNAT superfamily N-acetyltransferase